MAIDYGDARTGLAVSDPAGIIAGDSFTIHERNANALARRIAEAARERGVTRLVVGLPLNMNGTEGPRAGKSRALAGRLEAAGFEVALWDERLTTASAHHILNQTNTRGAKRKAAVDALAAALILEGYLRSL
jgi:putative Holliday junction resolvase